MSRNLAAAAKKAAPIFAALGDPTRMRIIAKLATGAHSITQLAEGETVTRQAITKHLAVLARANLVRDTKRGRDRMFELDVAPLSTVRSFLDLVGERSDQRLTRLAAYLDRAS